VLLLNAAIEQIISETLAAGDYLCCCLPENEALLPAAGDALLPPENEVLLLTAGDAPLLPENDALLLTAGDALLLPESEALQQAGVPTPEYAEKVGTVSASELVEAEAANKLAWDEAEVDVLKESPLHVGNVLLKVSLAEPQESVLLEVAPAVPELAAPEVDMPVVPGLLLLNGAAPASGYVKVVRASDDFFDQVQLLLKESPLHVGNVLLKVSLAEPQGSVLLDVAPAIPELATPEVDIPVVPGLLLDAELPLLLDGAVPASGYVKGMHATDDFFDKAQTSLKKSQLIDGCVLLELPLEVWLVHKVAARIAESPPASPCSTASSAQLAAAQHAPVFVNNQCETGVAV